MRGAAGEGDKKERTGEEEEDERKEGQEKEGNTKWKEWQSTIKD